MAHAAAGPVLLEGETDASPGAEGDRPLPRGLEGVVVADTTLGDVRGGEGFFHYRQYSAVELAQLRSFEDVWYLMLRGELPDVAHRADFADRTRRLRALPEATLALVRALGVSGAPLESLRTVTSAIGADLGWRPTMDLGAEELSAQADHLGAMVPTILAAIHRVRSGLELVEPDAELGHVANYLWMLTGAVPAPEVVRALEQYLVLTVDHGFNSSTFTARVITSTGADLASAVCGAIGALSGPLHGGAPSRALDMLDAIGSAPDADAWVRAAVGSGERVMGFGHRVYRTADPRSVLLREVAVGLGGPGVDHALECEAAVLRTLAELKPDRELYTNVEFYAGVVMEACGVPRDMFTATFAVSRVVGWTAHVLEQAGSNRLIRPAANYVGPEAPQPVPSQ